MRYLPPESPANWHLSEDRPWSQTNALLWRLVWELQGLNVKTAQMGGNKKAKMPDEMPRYPWSKVDDSATKSFGHVPEHRRQEALDYLNNL